MAPLAGKNILAEPARLLQSSLTKGSFSGKICPKTCNERQEISKIKSLADFCRRLEGSAQRCILFLQDFPSPSIFQDKIAYETQTMSF